MLRHKPFLGFLGRFAVIFGLLILPWPGWDELYGHYFRSVAQLAFSRSEGSRLVLFQNHELTHGFTTFNTRLVLGNRTLMDFTGKGPAETADLDTRSIGWIPTVLTAALILATPLPWRRRCWALFLGLTLVHLFILFTLQTWIWNELPALSLASYTSLQKYVADGLEYTFMGQMGVSFSVPILIWLLVTFRREDFSLLQNTWPIKTDNVRHLR